MNTLMMPLLEPSFQTNKSDILYSIRWKVITWFECGNFLKFVNFESWLIGRLFAVKMLEQIFWFNKETQISLNKERSLQLGLFLASKILYREYIDWANVRGKSPLTYDIPYSTVYIQENDLDTIWVTDFIELPGMGQPKKVSNFSKKLPVVI